MNWLLSFSFLSFFSVKHISQLFWKKSLYQKKNHIEINLDIKFYLSRNIFKYPEHPKCVLTSILSYTSHTVKQESVLVFQDHRVSKWQSWAKKAGSLVPENFIVLPSPRHIRLLLLEYQSPVIVTKFYTLFSQNSEGQSSGTSWCGPVVFESFRAKNVFASCLLDSGSFCPSSKSSAWQPVFPMLSFAPALTLPSL